MAIDVEATDFGSNYAHLNGTQRVPMSVWDIAVGAMLTLRSGPRDSVREQLFGAFVATELFARLQNVDHPGFGGRFRRWGQVVPSQSFFDLEPSEKAVCSFRIGSGLADCVAQALLGTSHLVHVWPLVQSGVIGLLHPRGPRPDFLGRDEDGNWHVVEAKAGLQPSAKAQSRAKRQARSVAVVRWPSDTRWPPSSSHLIAPKTALPIAPATNCTSIARLKRTPILVRFRDPPAGRAQVTYVVHESTVLNSYYDIMRTAVLEAQITERVVSGATFVGAPLAGTPIWIGAEQDLYPLVLERQVTPRSYARFAERWAPEWSVIRGMANEDQFFEEADVALRASVRQNGLAVFFDGNEEWLDPQAMVSVEAVRSR